MIGFVLRTILWLEAAARPDCVSGAGGESKTLIESSGPAECAPGCARLCVTYFFVPTCTSTGTDLSQYVCHGASRHSWGLGDHMEDMCGPFAEGCVCKAQWGKVDANSL